MARGRKKKAGLGIWAFRGAALLVLIAISFAAWFWWDMRGWRPDGELYPEQGAVIPVQPQRTNLVTLKAIGAQFAYLRLQPDPRSPDDDFASRYARAFEAGLEVGVLLPFNPCYKADTQSALFVQMVPRNPDLMNPAVELEMLADNCATPVSDAAVESELMTLINQIEMHSGKKVILKLGRDFEQRHNIARMIERDLWLERDRARPDYAGRPWLLWSANSQYVSEASEAPIEWMVVQR
ncbi:lysozyme M1 precursor [Erythrobacter longus]|uniref:Lysozyme M1 n=1 Tax=Erythrobacter longus TaxID=1044 RepID=A0A074M2G7_ERYLO|nr:glycoside hydrolase family 25 protein [Erythrobacter longus]KEO88601.1 lysozyme M1 precursor [Erythrobacter longus]